MVRERRAVEGPFAHLKGLNTRTDRRHDRRALSVEELQQLIQTTYNGPTRQGRNRCGKPAWIMTGPERSMLYRLAAETGLRSSELRSLTRASFDLDAETPTVTVEAAYTSENVRMSYPSGLKRSR